MCVDYLKRANYRISLAVVLSRFKIFKSIKANRCDVDSIPKWFILLIWFWKKNINAITKTQPFYSINAKQILRFIKCISLQRADNKPIIGAFCIVCKRCCCFCLGYFCFWLGSKWKLKRYTFNCLFVIWTARFEVAKLSEAMEIFFNVIIPKK